MMISRRCVHKMRAYHDDKYVLGLIILVRTFGLWKESDRSHPVFAKDSTGIEFSVVRERDSLLALVRGFTIPYGRKMLVDWYVASTAPRPLAVYQYR